MWPQSNGSSENQDSETVLLKESLWSLRMAMSRFQVSEYTASAEKIQPQTNCENCVSKNNGERTTKRKLQVSMDDWSHHSSQ